MSAIVDLFEFCRLARSMSGRVPHGGLGRLELADRSGELDWHVEGGQDSKGAPVLHLGVKGPVQLSCQRCLEPLDIDLYLQRRFGVVRSELEAENMPLDDDEFDPVVGSEQFDLLELVEDEVLLSLPVVPRHDSCPVDLVARHASAAPPSPFSALAGLKVGSGAKDTKN